MICPHYQNLCGHSGTRQKAGTTKYYATRFLSWFINQNGPLHFSVFAPGGNMKLPFYAFSSLPGFDCPALELVCTGTTNLRRKTLAGAGVTLLAVGDIRAVFSSIAK